MKKVQLLIIMMMMVLFMTACDNEIKPDVRISEYNDITNAKYSEYAEIQEVVNTKGDALLTLYLFDTVDSKLQSVFANTEMNTQSVTDSTDANEELLQNFYNSVKEGIQEDTYENYLQEYVQRKGINKADIATKINEWDALTEEEQRLKASSVYDYSDFALYNATIVDHDYYTNIATDNIYEVYIIKGQVAQTLSIIITWEHGKIMDVTRMYIG
jgi:hypothetical protein